MTSTTRCCDTAIRVSGTTGVALRNSAAAVVNDKFFMKHRQRTAPSTRCDLDEVGRLCLGARQAPDAEAQEVGDPLGQEGVQAAVRREPDRLEDHADATLDVRR